MTDEVTRSEFNGAIEGIRREIRSMGEHVGGDLKRIGRQLEDLMGVRAEEAQLIGKLAADVENLKEWKAGAVNSIRTLQIGLFLALVAACLGWLFRAGVR